MKVTRPVMRYYGGKFRLVDWILSLLPAHRFYIEPFGGSASVLMAKPRSFGEVYNDLDGEIVNVFRILRDPFLAEKLQRQVELTPYAREEFDLAYFPADDQVEQARRTLVKSFFGYGPEAIYSSRPSDIQMRTCPSTWTGMRSARKRGTSPATDWARYPDQIRGFTERLGGVLIENRDAIEVMVKYDDLEAVHYVDPPYVQESRSCRHGYRHEMTDEEHRRLADCLKSLKGMVVLSGYPAPLYDKLLAGWETRTKSALAQGAKRRTEVVWLNKRAASRLSQRLLEFGKATA